MSLNSKGIVLTHMKSCLESMQAFEWFPTYNAILNLKVKMMFSRDKRFKSNHNPSVLASMLHPNKPLVFFIIIIIFKKGFDPSNLNQTYLHTVGSKAFLAKQSSLIVWCTNFKIPNL